MKRAALFLALALAGCSGDRAGNGLPPGTSNIDGSGIERRVIDGKDCLWYESEDTNSHGHVVAFDCDWPDEDPS